MAARHASSVLPLDRPVACGGVTCFSSSRRALCGANLIQVPSLQVDSTKKRQYDAIYSRSSVSAPPSGQGSEAGATNVALLLQAWRTVKAPTSQKYAHAYYMFHTEKTTTIPRKGGENIRRCSFKRVGLTYLPHSNGIAARQTTRGSPPPSPLS